MKTTLVRLCALLAASSLGAGGLLRADDVRLTGNYEEAEAVPSESISASYAAQDATIQPEVVPSPAAVAPATCSTCCPTSPTRGSCCPNCGEQYGCCGPCSEPCPRVTAYLFSGVDSFRGITSGSYPNNNGGITGLNLGGALWEEAGIGWQVGGSYGVYNFSGRTSPGSQLNEVTQQGFITVGVFRRANINRRLSWGVVHDWMLSDNFGVFGNSPTLAQFRGQVAWAFSAKNEVGVWATVQDRSVTRATGAPAGGVFGAPGTPVSYQAIDQGNLFWHHKYGAYGADSWFYVGIPLDGRIATPANSAGFPVGGSGGSLGSAILGSNWLIPISDNLSGYANVMYMKPSAHEGVSPTFASAAAQEFWNVGVGLAWYPGHAARSQTVAGRQWMPYMPVANNSSFLVDSTKTE